MEAGWLNPCWPSSATSWEGSLSFRSAWPRRERGRCAQMTRQPPLFLWHLVGPLEHLQQVGRHLQRLEQHLQDQQEDQLRIQPILPPAVTLRLTRPSLHRYVGKLSDTWARLSNVFFYHCWHPVMFIHPFYNTKMCMFICFFISFYFRLWFVPAATTAGGFATTS